MRRCLVCMEKGGLKRHLLQNFLKVFAQDLLDLIKIPVFSPTIMKLDLTFLVLTRKLWNPWPREESKFLLPWIKLAFLIKKDTSLVLEHQLHVTLWHMQILQEI